MSVMKKSCDTCRYAYYEQDRSRHPTIGLLRQLCSNRQYNSGEYTTKMYLEDRGSGHCRYWEPEENDEENENEEQLYRFGA